MIAEAAIETIKKTPDAFQSEGGKFAESLKGDSNTGKDFADSLKENTDTGAGKSFKNSLKSVNSESGNGNHAEGISHNELKPLTAEDKERIKEETGWSDEIVDSIGSKEEYEIYKNAGLEEKEINGKPCLVQNEIDLEQKDEFGRTNKERMEQGLAPLDKNGKPVELHHMGQKPDSPLAELTQEEHRGKGNDSILHDKNKDSEIDRVAFSKEKEEHWETRADQAQKDTA